jgi:hypothetical protein
VSDQEPTEAEIEEQSAKERLREAESDAEETLERAEELSDRAPTPPPPPD